MSVDEYSTWFSRQLFLHRAKQRARHHLTESLWAVENFPLSASHTSKPSHIPADLAELTNPPNLHKTKQVLVYTGFIVLFLKASWHYQKRIFIKRLSWQHACLQNVINLSTECIADSRHNIYNRPQEVNNSCNTRCSRTASGARSRTSYLRSFFSSLMEGFSCKHLKKKLKENKQSWVKRTFE